MKKNETDLLCPQCDYKATKWSNMKTHLLSHPGPIKCQDSFN